MTSPLGFKARVGSALFAFCGGECNVHSLRSTSGATLADLLAAGVQPVLSPHTVSKVRLLGFEVGNRLTDFALIKLWENSNVCSVHIIIIICFATFSDVFVDFVGLIRNLYRYYIDIMYSCVIKSIMKNDKKIEFALIHIFLLLTFLA